MLKLLEVWLELLLLRSILIYTFGNRAAASVFRRKCLKRCDVLQVLTNLGLARAMLHFVPADVGYTAKNQFCHASQR